MSSADWRSAKRLALIGEAIKFIGVLEQTGHNDGPIIEQFQKAVGGQAYGQSYCMDFVQYCLQQVDKADPTTATCIFESQGCLEVFNKSPAYCHLLPSDFHKVVAGDVVVWEHCKAGKSTALGHCGIIIGIGSGGSFTTVEANTSSGTGISRDGDGVYKRVRSLAGSDTMRVKGFLRCWAQRK